MAVAIPKTTPMLSPEKLRALIAPFGVDRTAEPLILVGIRDYYRDSLGRPGVGDRGIYDDAVFVDGPTAFAAFNANTDPATSRPGRGTGDQKGMASLKPGLYRAHRFGVHRAGTRGGHPALIQIGGPVTVLRDRIGGGAYEDQGFFGINIHRGGINSTNSAGCQTIPPRQWPSFYALVQDQARRAYGAGWNRRTIPYLLLVAK